MQSGLEIVFKPPLHYTKKRFVGFLFFSSPPDCIIQDKDLMPFRI